jgi:hypothetical protein
MDENKKINELREELNNMIRNNLDPKEILKLSQELDIYIVEEMKRISEALDE